MRCKCVEAQNGQAGKVRTVLRPKGFAVVPVQWGKKVSFERHLPSLTCACNVGIVQKMEKKGKKLGKELQKELRKKWHKMGTKCTVERRRSGSTRPSYITCWSFCAGFV